MPTRTVSRCGHRRRAKSRRRAQKRRARPSAWQHQKESRKAHSFSRSTTQPGFLVRTRGEGFHLARAIALRPGASRVRRSRSELTFDECGTDPPYRQSRCFPPDPGSNCEFPDAGPRRAGRPVPCAHCSDSGSSRRPLGQSNSCPCDPSIRPVDFHRGCPRKPARRRTRARGTSNCTNPRRSGAAYAKSAAANAHRRRRDRLRSRQREFAVPSS